MRTETPLPRLRSGKKSETDGYQRQGREEEVDEESSGLERRSWYLGNISVLRASRQDRRHR